MRVEVAVGAFRFAEGVVDVEGERFQGFLISDFCQVPPGGFRGDLGGILIFDFRSRVCEV